MKKSTLLLIGLFATLLTVGQSLSIKEASGKSKNFIPSATAAQRPVICGYEQPGNAFQNGRPSNVGGAACADDIVVPSNECWTINTVTFNQFVSAPPTSADITFLTSTGTPSPNTVVSNMTNVSFTSSYLGSAFGYDIYEIVCTLPSPVTLCAGASPTTFWLSCQASDGVGTTYWEFQTVTTYNNGLSYYSGTGVVGPWSSNAEGYVFSLEFGSNNITTISGCDSISFSGTTYYTNTSLVDSFLNATGCDSLITTNIVVGTDTYGTPIVISDCDSYTWAQTGATYTSSGVYYDTIPSGAGCDSIITLDLTINNNSASSTSVTTCDSYFWSANSTTYTTGGNYQTTIANAAGCDSVVTLNLTINNSTTSSTDTVTTPCSNYVWPVNGMNYTSGGNYTDTLVNAAGCDSIVTLNLTLTGFYEQLGNAFQNGRPSSTGTSGNSASADDIVVPANECWTISTVTFNQFVNAAPVRADITFLSSTATPSPDTIISNMTNVSFTSSIVGSAFGYDIYEIVCTLPTPVTLCAGAAPTTFWLSCQASDGVGTTYWEFQTITTYNNATSYYSGTGVTGPWSTNTEGYVFALESQSSTVNNLSGCTSVTFGGNTYFSDIVLVDSFLNTQGCDSLIINIIDIESEYQTITHFGCDSVNLGGTTYFQNTTVVDSFMTSGGCDSIITNIIQVGGVQSSTTYSGCDSVLYNGTMYDSSFAVFDTLAGQFCDSIIADYVVVNKSYNITNNTAIDEGTSITIGGNTYSTAGTYVDSLVSSTGCDSVITTVLSITPDGMAELNAGINIYPNPTRGMLTIESKDRILSSIRIIDMKGSTLMYENINSLIENIDMSTLESGIYFYELIDEHNNVTRGKVIKK